jgi:hypothetical protein
MSSVVDRVAPSDLHIMEAIGLRVLESSDGGDGMFNADGTVNLVIQRPCAGRGPGNRIFTAEILERDCRENVFVGWPMFDNHESPQARVARGGIPRSPSELAGVVRECWWDPNFEDPELDAKLDYGRGAACVRAAVSDDMERLIRRMPEAIKTSVNALTTGLKRGEWRGRTTKPGWVVQGYVKDPEDNSIDFVTKAGAGGAVRRVLESVAAEDGHSWTVAPYSAGHGDPAGDQEDEVNLAEALESDAFARVLEAKVSEIIDEKGLVSEDTVEQRVREAVADQVKVRDLRDRARDRINAAKGISDVAKSDLLERFGATDKGDGVLEAAPALAAPADQKALDDAVDAALDVERRKVAEAAPTRPGGQGPAGGAGEDGATAPVHTKGSAWTAQMERAGVNVEKAYGVKAGA